MRCLKCDGYTKDTKWVRCHNCNQEIPEDSFCSPYCDDCSAGVSLEEQYKAELEYVEYMQERGLPIDNPRDDMWGLCVCEESK
tara:strand:+ start:3696 stop:3944 length:249 start_codon:yes stop_codon:yes gene_type:complete